jgi:Transposase IS200 like.
MNAKNLGSNILYCLWNTQNWEPRLEDEKAREELFNFLQARGALYGVNIDQMNGGSEHVHCLFLNAEKENLNKIILSLKKDANEWLVENGHPEIKWDNDYIVLPIQNKSQIKQVQDSIINQKKYHQLHSFAHEFNDLLKEITEGDCQ